LAQKKQKNKTNILAPKKNKTNILAQKNKHFADKNGRTFWRKKSRLG
jgi:hypothetical protein